MSGCTGQSQTSGEPVQAKFTVSNGTAVQEFFAAGTSGESALEAMKRAVPTEYQESAIGAFVKSINGKEAKSDEYWALYANGKYADKGIGSYRIGIDANEFEWKLEKINYQLFS